MVRFVHRVMLAKDADKSLVEDAARAAIPQWLEGKTIAKVIVVPNRLISFVIA